MTAVKRMHCRDPLPPLTQENQIQTRYSDIQRISLMFKIMWYTVFEGITNYTNYPKVIQVAGTTEDGKFIENSLKINSLGQFPPFLGPYGNSQILQI